jgi:hypothetical protein
MAPGHRTIRLTPRTGGEPDHPGLPAPPHRSRRGTALVVELPATPDQVRRERCDVHEQPDIRLDLERPDSLRGAGESTRCMALQVGHTSPWAMPLHTFQLRKITLADCPGRAADGLDDLGVRGAALDRRLVKVRAAGDSAQLLNSLLLRARPGLPGQLLDLLTVGNVGDREPQTAGQAVSPARRLEHPHRRARVLQRRPHQREGVLGTSFDLTRIPASRDENFFADLFPTLGTNVILFRGSCRKYSK